MQSFMPIQAFSSNIVKNSHIIINAKNFKNNIALRDSFFPFRCKGLRMHGATYSLSNILSWHVQGQF